MNSVAEMLEQRGNIEVGQLSKDLHISSRQLQRIFSENIGVSPKKFSSLMRYQNLWNDVFCNKNFATLFLRNLYLIACILYFVFGFFSRLTYDKKEVSQVLHIRGAKRIDKTSFSYLLLPSFNFSHKKRRTLRLFL